MADFCLPRLPWMPASAPSLPEARQTSLMQRTGLFDESSHDEHCGRCHASDRRQRRKVWRVAEVLDQEFGEDPYLACGMLA